MTMAMDYSDISILDGPELEEEIVIDTKISVEETTDTYGKFVVGPLDPGYGVTLGNPLRRVLYNSLPGTAVTWVKVETVQHEYSTIENVKEEVQEIVLNIPTFKCFVTYFPFWTELINNTLTSAIANLDAQTTAAIQQAKSEADLNIFEK